jgi:dihydropteroate synthase
MSAPPRVMRIASGQLALGGAPLLMGVVNATPDSFSDAGLATTLPARIALARELIAAGASVIDIGGESGVTNRRAVSPAEEIRRVVPLIERVVSELDVVVSIDTYKPAVAAAALAAGAAIVNDVSGLHHPELADVCATTGAGLVLMHTRAVPKQRLHDRAMDGRMADDVRRFLEQRMTLALDRGVAFEQLMLDPGPDFSKTPAQTVEVMRQIGGLHELERPLLLAASRKDFVGAITRRAPRERLAGTLATIGFGVDRGVHMLRVHDVDQVADYLAVRAVLQSEVDVDPGLQLTDQLRWQQGSG